MTESLRRRTPAAVARQLRQESGFGCCKCGVPIIQYHHIIEWAEEEHFRPQDMMVLCPTHHDQATKKAMPEEEQRRLKAEPFNIKKNRVNGPLEVKQDYCAADFGSVTVVGEGTFLSMNGEPVLGFHLGEARNLEVSLRLYDASDKLVLEIDRNEWVSGDSLPWDIEADWQTLTIRERARKISLSINGKAKPIEIRAEMWRRGTQVTLNKNGISFPHMKGGISDIALVGLVLNITMDSWEISKTEGHPMGVFVVWPQRRERLWRARDLWRQLVKGQGEAANQVPT